MITCEDTYHSEENGVWKNGKGETESALDGFLEDVISDYRPVCIRKDGIELVDDVGGIYGFCDMLRTIYETDDCDGQEEKSVQGRHYSGFAAKA